MKANDNPKTSVAARSASLGALFAPTDIASLVFFRIAFGAIMLWEVWRYFDNDWIHRYWIEPTFHFTYWGFGWIRPWPGDGMYLHFYALGLLALFVLLGLFYQISAVLLFLAFTFMFLLEQARYLNHFYLICLVSFLMIFIPAQRAFSLDVLLRPSLRSGTTPAWALWLLRAQIGIPYFFGGVAKLNSDWLAGNPLRKWLADRTDFPLIGPYFTEEWMVYLFTYGALLLDLFVVPLLLWKPTRLFAFATAAGFHILNAGLFSIGVFPWFMIVATTIFFRPDWPRRLLSVLRRKKAAAEPAVSVPSVSLAFNKRAVLCLLSCYVTLQLLLPLRHFLYPGNVSWTEEGHNFSWHMKLRSKQAVVSFLLTDPVARDSWRVHPDDHLQSWQSRKMSTRPDMILQFSHHLAAKARQKGHEQVEVRAHAMASLNGRSTQLLVDSSVNLALAERSFKPASWILPLQKQPSFEDKRKRHEPEPRKDELRTGRLK